MTVSTTSDGTVAPYDGEYDDVGLEDIGAGDVVIPRLQIQHADATFKDNLSGAIYESLDVILLGLVKQRIFWDSEVDDGDKPLCKSPDFVHGFPAVGDFVPKDKRFPWANSNFNPAQFPPGGPGSINGLVTLPCESCAFKEWAKKDGKSVPPPCAEQHTYPLLYTSDEGDTWTPALFTVQKTGIKPSRTYLSSFAQTKTPLFTVVTKLRLTAQSRGSVKYSVPSFTRQGATDRQHWPEWANQARSLREFVRTPPRPVEESSDSEAEPEDSTPTPAAAPARPVSKPKPEPTPEPTPEPSVVKGAPATAPVSEDEDDLPF